MKIERIGGEFSVCKVAAYRPEDLEGDFCFIGKTDGERSLVCRAERAPADALDREDGWRAFRAAGPLDFSLTGILAGIASALAAVGIGTEADIQKAVACYLSAAEAGEPFAMARLGYAYEKGEGIGKDEKLAMSWLIKAALRGDKGAIHTLKEDYQYTL